MQPGYYRMKERRHRRCPFTLPLPLMIMMAMTGCSPTPDADRPGGSMQADVSSIPLAVLGDSDSHSYGDRLWFPAESQLRGGRYRQATLQWTEVLERLRGDELDQGPWGTWGTNPRLAQVAGLIGNRLRAPRKEDYQYNFALTGATCRNLSEGVTAQTQHLVDVMQRNPERWRSGIVQIRIGINTLGTREFLDRSAAHGLSGSVAAEVASCADAVVSSAQTIRAASPSVRIVMVGVLNNSDWPPYVGHWQSALAQRNIGAVLDGFDDRLAAAASADANMAFFDDRAWFARHWGGRDASGMPAYKPDVLGDHVTIHNSQGDEPVNAILEDGHGATILNAIWARDFVEFLNRQFGLDLTPIAEAEVLAVAGID